MAQADLQLIGFELNAARHAEFAATHPGPSALRDFAAWGAFEQAHPDFFAGMYTIRVRR